MPTRRRSETGEKPLNGVIRRASAAPSAPKSTSMPASSQAANTCRGVHFPPGFAADSDAADLSFFASFSSIFASVVLE